MNEYILSIATLIAIYAILSVSLSLLVGHTGIFSMAHAALFGVGAYTYAVLTVQLGWGPGPALVVALLLAALAGAVMAIPSLRVSGDYFLVASFALQVVAGSVFENWTSVTGGTGGIPGIQRPTIGPLDFGDNTAFLGLAVAVAVLVVAVSLWLVRSPYGRMLHVVRDDEVVAATLGKPVRFAKVSVTVLSGAFAGLAGVLYAQYLLYLSPGTFEVATSVSIITMVVLGGMTSVAGSVIGAAVIVLIPQGLRQLDIASSVAGPLEQVFFGLLLVLLMFVRPQGLLGGSRRRPRPATDDVGDAARGETVHAA
ncbi:branched-chain amino acid ABC transporter permease [Geodermatophilus sp. DSM 44513]|uniref:branched-chain amino acid ABC transporter permease n=1 Tax=Geodermatophilus sp. DSM 44513 TaxID=1528104 RepID=UPI0012772D19|nr:branched-chain amino acid ABC transporter permease [Geodermatophilus sp. DSM 44513]WNV76629.1 branched-chain amino acid ABC transporter permease [Geodermatophilus sp. DSM 44513]